MDSKAPASSAGRVVWAAPALQTPAYVENVAPSNRADDHGAGNDFAYGALWMVLGLGVTVVTFAMAEPGGTFFLWWGPMVYGAWRILCGLFKSARA